tara:strand:+ start:5359 stop:5568 length:210 start_codon:yes stop_codon:yes gene_type:complete
MDAVQAQLTTDEVGDLAMASPCQGTETVPEEAVVDHQKVSVAVHGFGNSGLRRIHRRAQMGHLLRSFHL